MRESTKKLGKFSAPASYFRSSDYCKSRAKPFSSVFSHTSVLLRVLYLHSCEFSLLSILFYFSILLSLFSSIFRADNLFRPIWEWWVAPKVEFCGGGGVASPSSVPHAHISWFQHVYCINIIIMYRCFSYYIY